MKKHLAYILVIIFHIVHNGYAQIGIGTISPDASSIMELSSTNAGFLIPRMTKDERDAIASPAIGLQIYQLDGTDGLYYYDGIAWRTFTSGDKDVTTITETTTLNTAHEIVLVNNNAEIDIDLPTAVNNTGKTYYIKKVSDNVLRAVIDPNGSEKIDNVDSLDLFIHEDAVRIVSDGSNWHVISDELQPHMAKMTRDAAQSVSDNTATKINLDNVSFDIGGLADVTNKRIVIKRSGKYKVSGTMGFDSIGDGKWLQVYIQVNGGSVVTTQHTVGSSADNRIDVSDLLDLQAGDQVEILGRHNHGSNRNTFTGGATKPRISIMEVRE